MLLPLLSPFSRVQLCGLEPPQAPLSTEFSRQEYWSCHTLLQGIFPTQGSNLCLLHFRQISFLKKLIYFNWRLITLQYCGVFCHTLTWISHGCTYVLHPEPRSHLPPHPIPLGCPSALALSGLFHASNLDWWSISHMVIYMFQCYSLKSPHPRILPQSPKVCFSCLCLFCCLAYRVIITIFLNSIYMC